MAIENSNTPSSILGLRNNLFNGKPISIQLKPGEPCLAKLSARDTQKLRKHLAA